MSWSKRELVQDALAELGLGSYVFDIEPEEAQFALRRLDSMMATWYSRAMHLAYPLASKQQDSDLDQDSGVPDLAHEAITLNLALRLAGSYGKQASSDLRTNAYRAYQTLFARTRGATPAMQLQSMPLGAGNNRSGRVFTVPESTDQFATDDGGYLEFLGN